MTRVGRGLLQIWADAQLGRIHLTDSLQVLIVLTAVETVAGGGVNEVLHTAQARGQLLGPLLQPQHRLVPGLQLVPLLVDRLLERLEYRLQHTHAHTLTDRSSKRDLCFERYVLHIGLW